MFEFDQLGEGDLEILNGLVVEVLLFFQQMVENRSGIVEQRLKGLVVGGFRGVHADDRDGVGTEYLQHVEVSVVGQPADPFIEILLVRDVFDDHLDPGTEFTGHRIEFFYRLFEFGVRGT